MPLENKFWLRAQPLMHRLLSSELKDWPPIASLSGAKSWKSLGATSGEYDGCGRPSEDRSWIVATVERAVWGRALSCCNKTSVLRSPRHLDLIAGRRWFFRRYSYVALFTVFPWACIAARLPLVHPKRESALPFPQMVVCLTRSRRVCYRTSAVHELPSPLVHLLQWQTCVTILNFHSSTNFDGFHPFTT